MASLSPPLPTPIHNRITHSTNAIFTSSIKFNPIFQTHPQISLRRDRNPCFACKGSKRDLLIATLGLYGGSKMSHVTGDLGETACAAQSSTNKVVELSEFPITLDSVISVIVPRPKTSRSKKDKAEEEEVLAIQGIEFLADEAVKFDVHVNDDEDSLSRADSSEFAGSFVFLPHRRKTVTTSLRLGITDLLEDLGADGDANIKVTLVPKLVKRPLTIRQMKIEFLK